MVEGETQHEQKETPLGHLIAIAMREMGSPWHHFQWMTQSFLLDLHQVNGSDLQRSGMGQIRFPNIRHIGISFSIRRCDLVKVLRGKKKELEETGHHRLYPVPKASGRMLKQNRQDIWESIPDIRRVFPTHAVPLQSWIMERDLSKEREPGILER